MLERNFYKKLGKRLRVARKRIDFTPEDLAEELCMPVEQYLKIEAGEEKIDLPALSVVVAVTGKSADFLLTGRSSCAAIS